jgi:N-methylhydantoinase B
MATLQDKPLDPVTFEVIRHRLVAITDEMALTVKAVSGSPMVTDASDFNTGLYMPNGELVTMGRWMMLMAASLSEMAKHIIADCSENPGIGPGDQFIVNSPYKGALHAPDIGLLAPIFHEKELIGWAGGCSHQLDVGGMEMSSVCPEATDVRQEGMLIPPVKLVEADKPRQDLWSMITGMSRLPWNMSLDLKALIASNNVAKRHVATLIERYGVGAVRAAMEGLISYSESRMRPRLRELPDGVFRAVTYKDHDGQENRLYRIACTLTKRDDQLTFDYSDSSPQSPRFINCTESGLKGGVYAALFPTLAYDIPWNAGVLRALDVVARPGLVVNAAFPAPVSLGAVGTIWLSEVTALEALSKLVACSPTLVQEAQACPPGGPDILRVFGLDQYGEPFGTPMLDQGFTGEAAYHHRDGMAGRGVHCAPQQQLPNVERIESAMPLLYLYRRYAPDTGGPGRKRGGVSATVAYAVRSERPLTVIPGGHGFEVPNSLGVFGGYPGACNQRVLLRNTDVWERTRPETWPQDVRDLAGEEQRLVAQPGKLMLRHGDVYAMTPETGGGWGDPLTRDADSLAQDVAAGLVSRDVASDVYGVVLGADGTVDAAASAERRARIRTARQDWPARQRFAPPAGPLGAMLWRLGDHLEIVATSARPVVRCTTCGTALAPADENWKLYAPSALLAPEALGPFIRLHADLEARAYACPGCGTLLAVEVLTHDAPPLWDAELALP